MIGRWARVLAALWRFGASEAMAYRASLLVWILTSTFPLISLALWAGIARDAPVGEFSRGAFVAYFVAAFLVRQMSASWAVWDLERQIATGELSTLLLRPVHPLAHHAMINLAALPIRTLLAIPLALAVLFAADEVTLLHASPAWWLAPAFAAALIGAWLIGFAVQVAIGSLAFWLTSTSALYEVWVTCYVVLSGFAVPTSLFPAGLADAVRYLPFHACLGFPVELLIGRLSASAVATGLWFQWAWVVTLGAAAILVWRRGVRVYGAEGA